MANIEDLKKKVWALVGTELNPNENEYINSPVHIYMVFTDEFYAQVEADNWNRSAEKGDPYYFIIELPFCDDSSKD